MGNFRDKTFIALQRLLPQHGLSRCGGWLANVQQPTVKNFLIRRFIQQYDINLREAASADPNDYSCFNAFFTRELRNGTRNIDQNTDTVVYPADGTVSQQGTISNNTLIQAKGKSFSVQQLLGSAPSETDFNEGSFITIYLSPRDYHRVHMPMDGKLIESRYIPGKLFSVNGTTAMHIDGLFAHNERLVCIFETPLGKVALVLVGAMMVAGIETVWQPYYPPRMPLHKNFSQQHISLQKGEEMGRFKFGSTVIALFQKDKLEWSQNDHSTKSHSNKNHSNKSHNNIGSQVNMGKAMASFRP